MNDGYLALAALALFVIASIGIYTFDHMEDRYLLEMGVPHCVVFDYDCGLVKEDNSDG